MLIFPLWHFRAYSYFPSYLIYCEYHGNREDTKLIIFGNPLLFFASI